MITSPKSRTLIAAFVALAAVAHAQQYPKQAQLPNPYRLVENWPTVPQNMNGGRWGELIRADIDRTGNIWVFHRCFNTEPAGAATCVGRKEPPILEFNPAGKLLTSSAAACSRSLTDSPSTSRATCGSATPMRTRRCSACPPR